MNTMSQRVSQIFHPDEVEAYVKMPDYLMQETILPTMAFMRECFCFSMLARTIRKGGFPAT